jgi:hypothetical protein
VAKVKLREVFASSGTSNFFRPTSLRSRSLELLDAHGATLLKVALPLRSAEASKVFEASLPVWTNRAIEVEQIGK